MPLKYATLIAALLVPSSQSAWAQSTFDAVDALFAPGPSTSVGEPSVVPGLSEADDFKVLDNTNTGGLAVPESVFSAPPSFSATDDRPSVPLAVGDVEPSAAAHKSTTGWRVDAVPEPSALAMGAVALIFFLFLGHRRRLG